jgi:hypothetical protein
MCLGSAFSPLCPGRARGRGEPSLPVRAQAARRGRRPRACAAGPVVFCAHYSDWACTADGIVYVSIVSNPPHVPCAIIVSGEKHRIANPQDRLVGLARTDCFAGGRPDYFAETLSEHGVMTITDGPGSLMANPRRLDATEPVTMVNAAELADEPSRPTRPH